uniref:Globin family profile domain-containing protein n=1 Tax=Parascaris equorum TaxID=6256 RepID=A0A914RW02_PAREQ
MPMNKVYVSPKDELLQHYMDDKSASTTFDEVMGCSFDNATTAMGECDEMPELDDLQMARAHWIQLFKTNMQVDKISLFDTNNDDNWQKRLIDTICWMDVLMFETFKWGIGEVGEEGRRQRMRSGTEKKEDGLNVYTVLNMIMENVDDVAAMNDLLQQLGAHHFFYGAYEPHFETYNRRIEEMELKLAVKIDEDSETFQQLSQLITAVSFFPPTSQHNRHWQCYSRRRAETLTTVVECCSWKHFLHCRRNIAAQRYKRIKKGRMR